MLSLNFLSRYETQVKKCLDYFQGLRERQLERRHEKNKEWELSFLAPETWRNLRMSCRGFFAYCRAMIQYTDCAKPGTVARFYGVSTAHDNSSGLEAWFGTVRNSKADSTTRHQYFVANKVMRKANVDVALGQNRNKMYSAGDVGELHAGKDIGPSEFIKYHSGRENRMSERIVKYDSEKTYKNKITPVPAFSSEVNKQVPTELHDFEIDVLKRLSSKQLSEGYLVELMNQEFFRQWMRLSLDAPSGEWFSHFFEDTLEVGGAEQFEQACQAIQNILFDITVKSLRQRNDDQNSFEYDLHQYFMLEEFALLCWNQLPGRLSNTHPGCVMLFLSLVRMHLVWLKDALFDSRKQRNPELFFKPTTRCLTPEEENSEVNRFLGWSIFSSMKKYTKDSTEHVSCKKILSSMMVRERNIDDDYLSKYYDSHMALLNRGGLTLVHKTFFEWGKSLLSTIRNNFSVDDLERDPKNAFSKSKAKVMDDQRLWSWFMALCRRQSLCTEIASEVYTVFLLKTIHARFFVVFRHWKEANVKRNGQVAFRIKLKAQNSAKSKASKASSTPTLASVIPEKRKEPLLILNWNLIAKEGV